MNIQLTAIDFDLLGHVSLRVNPDSDIGETSRRNNRIATLDGGAVLNDGGFSEADRTMTLRWKTLSNAQRQAVDRMVKLHSLFRVSTPDGVFSAAPGPHRATPNDSSLSLFVMEKLA